MLYYTNRPESIIDLKLPEWQTQWGRGGRGDPAAMVPGRVNAADDKRSRDYLQANIDGNCTRFVERKDPAYYRTRHLTKLDGEIYYQQNCATFQI